jgi:hypothetical protein
MILLLIGGIVLTGLSLVVLIKLFSVLRRGQRAVEELGITDRMPVHPQSMLIIAAWSLALVVGTILIWFYFR